MHLPNAISFCLLQTVLRRQPFVFGFQYSERNRLGSCRDRPPQNIIRAPRWTAPRLMIYDIDWLRRFLNPNVRLSIPSALLQRRIDQLKPNLGLITRHWFLGQLASRGM